MIGIISLIDLATSQPPEPYQKPRNLARVAMHGSVSIAKPKKIMEKVWYGGLGELGAISIKNIRKRITEKFRIIILFDFGLVTVRINYWKPEIIILHGSWTWGTWLWRLPEPISLIFVDNKTLQTVREQIKTILKHVMLGFLRTTTVFVCVLEMRAPHILKCWTLRHWNFETSTFWKFVNSRLWFLFSSKGPPIGNPAGVGVGMLRGGKDCLKWKW